MKQNLQAGLLKSSILIGLLSGIVLSMPACGPAPDQPDRPGDDSQKPRVVVTTTIVGDIVGQIGGETIDLHLLLPAGADPHTFEPTPQDLAVVAEADAIFINGVGLEEFLDRLLENAGGSAEVISVSEGIVLRQMEDDDEHGHEEADPHVWTDPNNVMVWTENIERALSHLDPANAASYAANARDYREQLEQLDAWILAQVDQIPPAKRLLVTDHETLGYFADRFGFEQSGALIQGFSTGSSPSAQELAALTETIREHEIPAIFVGSTVNPNISQRLAEDARIQVVALYTDSLNGAQGEASTYLDLMRHNVAAIVAALE